MKFTLSWLKKHIDLNPDYSIEKLCKKLDEIGLEVEYYEDSAQKYKNFTIYVCNSLGFLKYKEY